MNWVPSEADNYSEMKTSVAKQRGQTGRASIIKGALAVFSRKGFESTSVEEICLATGYSKGGFYFHFRGKDELLAALLDGDGEMADKGRLDALSAELWAQAGRDEAVRHQLARGDDARYRKLLEATITTSRDPKSSSRLLSLLLLLNTGLHVQQRFFASPGDDAKRFVDSMLASLTYSVGRSTEGRRGVAGGRR